MLEQLGHHPTLVVDGHAAVNALREGQYDAALLDVQMPGMDGLSAARAIRAMAPPQGGTPLIGVTASLVRAELHRCIEAGMDDAMLKPVEPAALQAALERVIRARRR